MSISPITLSCNGKQIRTAIMNSVPKFSASDICRILDYANPGSALSRFRLSRPEYITMDTPGGSQRIRMIGCIDLLTLLKGSRKRNNARMLKGWLENKLLPSLAHCLSGHRTELKISVEIAMVTTDRSERDYER